MCPTPAAIISESLCALTLCILVRRRVSLGNTRAFNEGRLVLVRHIVHLTSPAECFLCVLPCFCHSPDFSSLIFRFLSNLLRTLRWACWLGTAL